MKNITKTLMMSMCLALAGCGLSDPWEEWSDEGKMPADRVVPSEVKETLCSAEGWKMTYQEVDFYYSFDENGTVTCNSNLFVDQTLTSYHFNWTDPSSVILTVEGAGHLASLEENPFGNDIVITDYSSESIACTDESGTVSVTMTPVTSADIEAMDTEKWQVRTYLVSEDWWTFNYGGYDFYYKFAEDGTVQCNSNIPQQASSSTYAFSGTVDDLVLTINGGGHISYLPEESRIEAFNVGASSATEIELTPVSSQASLKFVPATDAKVEEVDENKGASLVSNAFVQNNYHYGVVRNSDGLFLAHYVAEYENDGITTELGNVEFDVLYDRKLTHKTVSVASVESDGTINFSEPVSINGTEVSSMVYNTADNTLSVGEMHVTSNIDAADWFINDFKTYVIIPGENRGDAEESLMSEIKTAADKGWGKWEISDRDNRPLICTGRTWVCFYGSAQAKPEDIRTDEKDKIKFPLYETDGIRGFSSKDEAAIAEVEGLAPNLLDVFFDSEWYVILEGEKNADNSQLYLISSDTDKWFKADRDM